MGTRQLIGEFLSQKRFAIVGVSRNPKEFSHKLFIEFLKRGYEAIPVNPKAVRIAGLRCHGTVCSIQPPVWAALLLTPAHMNGWVIKTCIQAGIHCVWMHRGEGAGAVDARAVELCQGNGIKVIEGYCPYMFLAHPGLIHRAHGTILKLNGQYPA